jgi:hypothetical protein
MKGVWVWGVLCVWVGVLGQCALVLFEVLETYPTVTFSRLVYPTVNPIWDK